MLNLLKTLRKNEAARRFRIAAAAAATTALAACSGGPASMQEVRDFRPLPVGGHAQPLTVTPAPHQTYAVPARTIGAYNGPSDAEIDAATPRRQIIVIPNQSEYRGGYGSYGGSYGGYYLPEVVPEVALQISCQMTDRDFNSGRIIYRCNDINALFNALRNPARGGPDNGVRCTTARPGIYACYEQPRFYRR